MTDVPLPKLRPPATGGAGEWLSAAWQALVRYGVWRQGALALAYFALGWVTDLFASTEGPFAGTFYLHEGMSLAMVALSGLVVLPGMALGHLVLALFEHVPPLSALLSTAANVLVLCASAAYLRAAGFRASLARPLDFILLASCSLLPFQWLSSLCGLGLLYLTGVVDSLRWADVAAIFSAGMVGATLWQLLVAAVMLTSVDQWRCGRSPRYWAYGLAAATAVTLALVGMLWGWLGHWNALHMLSAIYLLVMAFTYAFALHGAVLGNLTVLVVVQWATNRDMGPFANLLNDEQSQSTSVYLLGIVLSSCLIGALLREKGDRERRLVELATRDPLTGLFNRRYFFDTAERDLRRVRRRETSVLLLWFDLDHFKAINDNYGHVAGDEVLREVGAVLRETCRGSDLAARMGGEEFAVLASADHDQALVLAERLRAALRLHQSNRPSLVQFTVSIGITHLREDDADVNASLHRADTALYEAKRRGRDCVVVFED